MKKKSLLKKFYLIGCIFVLSISHLHLNANNLLTLPEDSVSLKDSISLTCETEKIPIVDYKFKATRFILPATLLTAGVVGTAFDGWNDYHLFTRKDSVSFNNIDDYLEWGMLGWVFLCDLMGKEKHSLVDQLFILGIAEGINGGITMGIKKTVDLTRPDGGGWSFPSGHTSNAFLGAHIAFKEFKDSSPVLAYSGYAAALFVAGSRVYKNRHWVADVVAGAGIGILSAELSYMIYFPIRNAIARNINAKADKNLVVVPMVNMNGGGVYFSWRF